MNHILVALRSKPQSSSNQAENLKIQENNCWKLNSSSQATVTDARASKYYELDYLFGEESTNQEIFEKLILEPTLNSLEGSNLTIMAYGQTASGKTHTIYGTSNDPGLLNQTIDVIFREMRKNLLIFQLKISYLEMYNEQVNDLLDPSRSNLEIREQPRYGICVHRLSEVIFGSEVEVLQLLRNGNFNRRTGETIMNHSSSRSHSILKIWFEIKDIQAQQISLISFVDLAGSGSIENIKEQSIEGAYIKKSLLSLSLVIKALRFGNRDQAHFRQSKLTRLLQPLLCIKSQTVIVCTVNLNSQHYQETKKTLHFGCNARNIRKELLIEEVQVKQELEPLAQESQLNLIMQQALKIKESDNDALKQRLAEKDIAFKAIMIELEETKRNLAIETENAKKKEADLIIEIENAKKKEADLIIQFEGNKNNLAKELDEAKRKAADLALQLEEARKKPYWLEGLVETINQQKKSDRHPYLQEGPQNIVLLSPQSLISSGIQANLEINENRYEAEQIILGPEKQAEELLPKIEENLSQLSIHKKNLNKAGSLNNQQADHLQLEEANEIGSEKCTLIIANGPWAKTLIEAALKVIGREKIGVLYIQDKFSKTSRMCRRKILETQEAEFIIKVLGLVNKTNIQFLHELRYSKIVIMADNNYNQLSLKRFVRMIISCWPKLIRCRNFILDCETPFAKVSNEHKIFSFYKKEDYESWKNLKCRNSWDIKIYNGISTINPQEAHIFLSATEKKKVDLDEIFESLSYNLQYSNPIIKITKSTKELNAEMIPSVYDGLTFSQRKVLFCSFKRNLEAHIISVDSLSIDVLKLGSSNTPIEDEIIGLAQNFVGKNNLNILLPLGDFGTRHTEKIGAIESLYTKLSPVARYLFPHEDDKLYYMENEGEMIVPKYYLPIIPLVLVNGFIGIGNMSLVMPKYNPLHIISLYKQKIAGKDYKKSALHPWYRGYSAAIEWNSKMKCYNAKIHLEKLSDNWLLFKELPLNINTCKYRNTLEKRKGKKLKIKVLEIQEFHTKHEVCYRLNIADLTSILNYKLADGLVLRSSIPNSDFRLTDNFGQTKMYKSIFEIIEEHYAAREILYVERMKDLIAKLKRECETLRNIARFINEQMDGQDSLNIDSPKRQNIKLHQHEYTSEQELDLIYKEKFGHSSTPSSRRTDFSYLVSIPRGKISYEYSTLIQKDLEKNEAMLLRLLQQSPNSLWEDDLNKLEDVIKNMYEDDQDINISLAKELELDEVASLQRKVEYREAELKRPGIYKRKPSMTSEYCPRSLKLF